MGWVWLIVLAALTLGGLALLRFPRPLWTFAAAAAVLGAAGYAWQGSPALPGRPVAAATQAGAVDPEVVALREAMFGRFNFDDAYFRIADAMTRTGDPRSAALAMLGAARKAPDDAALWTWLGVKLAEQDGGIVSPASRLAFDRALGLAPRHPGPPFFLGLALVRANDFEAARPFWARALALTPPGASYRDALALRLALLDRLLAMRARAPAMPR